MAVEQIYYSEDGVEQAFIRALDSNGDEVGLFLEVEGISDESFTRNVNEREVLTNNKSFKKDAKFQSYSGDVQIHALRMDMMEFYLAGDLDVQGGVAEFTEDPNGLPKRFALYITYPLDGANGEPGKGYTKYADCRTANIQKPRQTGQYVVNTLTIDALVGKDGYARKFVCDSDGVGLNTSGDTTAPVVSSTNPDNGDSDIAVDFAIVVQFSKAMHPKSLDNVVLYRQSTGQIVATAAEYVESGGPPATTFALTVTPEANLAAGAAYSLLVPNSVRDSLGNFLANELLVSFTTAA